MLTNEQIHEWVEEHHEETLFYLKKHADYRFNIRSIIRAGKQDRYDLDLREISEIPVCETIIRHQLKLPSEFKSKIGIVKSVAVWKTCYEYVKPHVFAFRDDGMTLCYTPGQWAFHMQHGLEKGEGLEILRREGPDFIHSVGELTYLLAPIDKIQDTFGFEYKVLR